VDDARAAEILARAKALEPKQETAAIDA